MALMSFYISTSLHQQHYIYTYISTNHNIYTILHNNKQNSYNFVELRTAVLENKAFKSLLELAPRARLMVQQFCDTDYGGCLQYLELRAEDARLDIYLCNHIHVRTPSFLLPS